MTTIARVGQGYDLHRLTEGRRLVLAGVNIDFAKGLAGHSDADVVLHAVIDALLGAAGLADIGEQFPDTDPAYAGIDSSKLMAMTIKLVMEQGFGMINVDVTVLAEQPKLTAYKPAMRNRLSELLGLEPERVSVKAKTNERLGPVGRGEAIGCLAIVSLKRI